MRSYYCEDNVRTGDLVCMAPSGKIRPVVVVRYTRIERLVRWCGRLLHNHKLALYHDKQLTNAPIGIAMASVKKRGGGPYID